MKTFDELVEGIKEIKDCGFVKTHRADDTGIGKTLEDLLGIKENNLGACIGGSKWIDNTSSDYIESFNPTNREFLGRVKLCDKQGYEDIINASNEAFLEWRMVPAPIRGQLILKMANELRNKKDLLGSLVSLEMG